MNPVAPQCLGSSHIDVGSRNDYVGTVGLQSILLYALLDAEFAEFVAHVLYLAHENLLRVFLLMCEFEEFVDKCLLFRYYLYLCIAVG